MISHKIRTLNEPGGAKKRLFYLVHCVDGVRMIMEYMTGPFVILYFLYDQPEMHYQPERKVT